MKSVYQNLGTIIGFAVVVLLVQNFIGEKAGEYTVLFTLLTMVLLNADKVQNLLNNTFK